jgi:hypothetical protein
MKMVWHQDICYKLEWPRLLQFIADIYETLACFSAMEDAPLFVYVAGYKV